MAFSFSSLHPPGLSRLSLRAKIWLGFGGLFCILLAVGGMSVVVLTVYSGAFERIFHENYDTVQYCDAMKESLEQLTAAAQHIVTDPSPPTDTVARWVKQFSDNIEAQLHNCFLVGEQRKSDTIAEHWSIFREQYQRFLEQGDQRAEIYRDVLLPQKDRLHSEVQEVSEMNLRNMVEVDGQVRATLASVRKALVLLVVAGGVFSLIFISLVARSMLRPLLTLTRSAQQIAEGKLELNVDVPGVDEIGQLAQAFSSMAARLRESRRLDHDRLARSEQTTQMALDSFPDAIAVLNPKADIELLNRAARDRFGLCTSLSVSDRPPWMQELFERVMCGGQPIEPQGYQSAIQRFEKGEERFDMPHATPLKGDDGRVAGVIVILSDVTRLKQADEAKSGLVSTVSHELKTPLTSMRLAIHMLADQETFGPLSERQAEILATFRNNTERLLRTVENLLSIGRIESGRAPLRLQPMSATDLVDNAVEPLRQLFQDRGIRIIIEPSTTQKCVLADAGCIGHVVTNLLTNAAKYAPIGGEVRIQIASEYDAIRITVEDNGPGISLEHLPHIFEKFYRAPVAGAPPGAGLGLAIAREIVSAHGGTISAGRRPSGGAQMSFTLPCETSAENRKS